MVPVEASSAPERKLDVLNCLQGLKCIQSEIRAGRGWSLSLREAARYVEKLPEKVIKRLTEIDVPALLEGCQEEVILKQLASDAAFEQVIRAANIYRAERGLNPLSPDGWPEWPERN